MGRSEDDESEFATSMPDREHDGRQNGGRGRRENDETDSEPATSMPDREHRGRNRGRGRKDDSDSDDEIDVSRPTEEDVNDQIRRALERGMRSEDDETEFATSMPDREQGPRHENREA